MKRQNNKKRNKGRRKEDQTPCHQRPSSSLNKQSETKRTNELKDAEFVDTHRATLIQRVVMVMVIVDVLLQKGMIHDELYSTIHTTQPRQEQMRKLYDLLTTVEVKSAFYRILQEKEPCLVKELKGTSQTTQGSVKQPVILRVKKKLQASVKKSFRFIFEGTTEEEETLLNSIYTELYITDGESEGVNREHEIRQIESFKKSSATPIKCNNIFKPRDTHTEKRAIRVLMTKGIAGIGKTVSVRKFILDWAEGKANQDIDFIFVLPFRELNSYADQYSLHGILCEFHPELKEITDASIFASCTVLFIFDGLDESRLPLSFRRNNRLSDVTKTASVDVLLTNLIKGHLLPDALLWITTRPAAAHKIERQYIQHMTELRGFTDQQKHEYFKKQFSEDENLANKIIERIKTTRSLLIMCYIPIMCWITAKVLKCMLRKHEMGNIPKTVTEMYIRFLIIQSVKSDEKYEEENETDTQKILQSRKDFILKLAQLAFQQLLKGNLIFYEKDLKECDIDVNEAAVKSGLCTEILKEECGMLKTKVYSFVHLTFQEFLAALYVFYCCVTKNMDALKPLLENVSTELPLHEVLKRVVDKTLQSENGHLDLFLRFLLGISLKSNQNLLRSLLTQTESSSETAEEMKKYLRKPDLENISIERQVNLFLCLTEMEDSSVHEDINRFLMSPDRQLTDDHCSALANALLMSQGVLDEMDQRKYNSADYRRFRLIPAVRKCRKAVLTDLEPSLGDWELLASTLQSSDCPLRELHLMDFNLVDDSLLWVVFAALRDPYCKLETLRLTSMELSHKDCETLASTLQSPDCPLRELHLEDIRWSYDGIIDQSVVFAALTGPNCKLETLRLENCFLEENKVGELASALSSNSHLRELDLSRNDLQDSRVKLLSDGLKSPNCRLEILRLSFCRVTEEGYAHLASVLSSNPSYLRELDLSFNHPGDSGVKLLSDGLKSPNCRLEILRLSFCRVTEEGCADLASALRSNPSHLRELDLSFNHPGDSGVKLLSDPLCRLEKLNVTPNEDIWVKPRLLKKYALYLNLDINTVNHLLSLRLSEDNKRVLVAWSASWHQYPDHPERFDSRPQFLCREDLTGRHYWEVEVEEEKEEVVVLLERPRQLAVTIGVTYKSIRRKGDIPPCRLGCNDKSWVLYLENQNVSVLHNREQIVLSAWLPRPRRVGVYLDWPAGVLSFYSISSDTVTHLFTFHTTFTEPLCPAFWVRHCGSLSLCS